MRFAIVAARFNHEVTGALQASALRTLKAAGVPGSAVVTVWVPGSYEIPWAAQEMALTGRFDAVICLGAVLKGQTPQNDLIAQACAVNVQRVALETRVPCVFAIITPRTWAQAVARTRGLLDRGREAAEVALAMARLRRGLKRKGKR